MSRQSWSVSEDQAIIKLVQEYGIEDWTKIAWKLRDYLGMQRRTGKQCRERWYNHLSPSVNKMPWTEEEEELLFIHHKNYGNRWKDISRLFIGRTDNDIKNHFYSTLRRSLRRLNKIVGEKNSTTQMRQIKPSVLSTIMNYIYQQEHAKTELLQSLKDLPILIFDFAKFKPIKMNIKNANIEMIKQKTGQIFTLITRFNQEYQKNKQFRRCLKTQKKFKRFESIKSSSNRVSSQVKIEQQFDQEKDIYIKKEYIDQQENKNKVEVQKTNHAEHKNNQKTEFSMHQDHYDSYHHEQLTPLAILSSLAASPKITIKDAPINYPSNHRAFSLQADQINDMHFNQPQQPSRINIDEHEQFNLHHDHTQQKGRAVQQSQLIDEVIQTHYGR